jgi:hypothetical protein
MTPKTRLPKTLSLEENIALSEMVYWTIFANRDDILCHFYCVLGNGYRWYKGRLVSVIDDEPRDLEAYALYRAGKRDRLLDPLLTQFGLHREQLQPRQECYPCDEKYGKLHNVPDDVKLDYLLGAFETIFWLRSLDARRGSNAHCRKLAEKAYTELTERFVGKGKKIDPNKLKVRDPLMVKIINGATKAGVQKDQKKEAAKKACRKPVADEE